MVSILNNKHRRTLNAVFEDPVRPDVRWAEVERLLEALGERCSEGRGSRVRVVLGTSEAVFHRPHPRPETDKGALKAVRRFLEIAGIRP